MLGLVRADPTQRPSAADLLNGPLLPAPRELSTEVLDAATSAAQPLSPARATLLDALFDAPTSELVDVAYDQNERGAFSLMALRDARAHARPPHGDASLISWRRPAPRRWTRLGHVEAAAARRR